MSSKKRVKNIRGLGKQPDYFRDPFSIGADVSRRIIQQTSGYLLEGPHGDLKKPYVGYLSGTAPPACLGLAAGFWTQPPYEIARDGDINLPLEFNRKTYDLFLKYCYQEFLNGKIAGAVIFDQPSMADVKAVLNRNGVLNPDIRFSDRAAAKGSALGYLGGADPLGEHINTPRFKNQYATMPGLPESKVKQEL